MDSSVLERLCSLTQQLVGKKCWNVRPSVIEAGFSLDFGDERKFEKESNSAAPELGSTIRGQYVIWVGYSAWRIDDHNSDCVLATYRDAEQCVIAEHQGNRMWDSLQRLVSATVTSLSIQSPGIDCSITFDNGLVLEVFPFEILECNHGFALGDQEFIVNAHSELTVRARGGMPESNS